MSRTARTDRPVPRELLRWVDRLVPEEVLADGPRARMRQRLLVAFGLLMLVCTMPWFVAMFARDPAIRLPRMVALSVFILLAGNVLWIRLIPSRAVAWMTVLLLHGAFLSPVLLNGGLEGPVALVLPCLPVLTAVLLGIRHGWIAGALLVAFAGTLEWLTPSLQLPLVAPAEIWSLLRIMALAIGLSLMLLAVSAYAELSFRQSRELVEARDDALAASRAKSRFLSTVSHELRTPMVGVVGAIDLLERSDPTATQRELIGLLQRSAAAQLELVGNVLDLSRIEADRTVIEHQPVSPQQLLAGLESLFRVPCQAKGLELHTEIGAAVPPWIVGDRLRLRQVLSNLVGNALKFTDQGRITVELQADGSPQQPRLRCTVSDTGIGFDTEHAEELFEPFRQGDGATTRRYGGSGLGLTICRRLVEAMDGHIQATGEPGVGARFVFEVPAEAATPPVDARPDGVAGPTAKRLKILLADDDPVNRTVLSAMLEELGHSPIEAADGREAIELVTSEEPDLILLDMHMPELDGPGCARALRRMPKPTSALPILGLTADAILENQTRYLAAGLDAVYSKPIAIDRLGRAIAEVTGPRGAEAANDPTVDDEYEVIEVVPGSERRDLAS